MTDTNKETVTITKEKYEYLLDRVFWLSCLENAGVDNWHGCEDAYNEYEEYTESE